MINDIKRNIDKRQYGNLKGRSTNHYLIYLLDELYKGLDNPNTIVALILIDFKKAFDYVDHSIAINELLAMGCRASIMPFIGDFLTGRSHRGKYMDALSDFSPITCGVPQGTRAGPIIFLALVNSLCQEIEKRAKFVDDLSLAHIISILKEINYAPLQENLDIISTECTDKHMDPNPIKCGVMYSIPVKRPLTLPDLQLNGQPLPVVQECKVLGVHLNTDLTWDTHVAKMISRANKCIFVLIRAKKFKFTIKTLVTLYLWYIRTALEYAAPVWHPGLTELQHADIERVQRRCVRLILGTE